jgi:hypothetical protein
MLVVHTVHVNMFYISKTFQICKMPLPLEGTTAGYIKLSRNSLCYSNDFLNKGMHYAITCNVALVGYICAIEHVPICVKCIIFNDTG